MIVPFPSIPGITRTLLLLALALVAMLVPLAIYHFDLSYRNGIIGRTTQWLDFFRFAGTVFVLLASWSHLRTGDATDRLRGWLFVAASLAALWLATGSQFRAWDYQSYEDAAHVLAAGDNPYQLSYYLYPPLTIEILAGLATLMMQLGADQAVAWDIVFYFFTTGQWFVLIAIMILLFRILMERGWSERHAALATLALTILNYTVVSSIRGQQISLVLLAAVLVVLKYHKTEWFLAGAVLAVAIHLKLYPALLVIPLIVAGSWRAILATVVVIFAIVALQWWVEGDLLLYVRYLEFARSFPVGTHAVQNCITSLLINFSFGAIDAFAAKAIHMGLVPLLIVWLLLRIRNRERMLAQRDVNQRFLWHASDTLAFSILVSPIAYDHHYVLAIPLILMASARGSMEQLVRTVPIALLLFAIPTFDLFPFSYHRIAGLLWLIGLTAPRRSALLEIEPVS